MAMLGADVEALDAVMTEMEQALVRFIRTGTPDAERWPPYDATRRHTYVFDNRSSLISDPERELRSVWEGMS